MGVVPLALADKNQFIGNGSTPPVLSSRGLLSPGDAVMNRATRNQLLISYMEHMEKAEQALDGEKASGTFKRQLSSPTRSDPHQGLRETLPNR